MLLQSEHKMLTDLALCVNFSAVPVNVWFVNACSFLILCWTRDGWVASILSDFFFDHWNSLFLQTPLALVLIVLSSFFETLYYSSQNNSTISTWDHPLLLVSCFLIQSIYKGQPKIARGVHYPQN